MITKTPRLSKAGREYTITCEHPDRTVWVQITRGSRGNLVGKIQEGQESGMLVFFDEHTQAKLVDTHFACVCVTHTQARYGFASLGDFLLTEKNRNVETTCSIIGEKPIYGASSLVEAVLRHDEKMQTLLTQRADARVAELNGHREASRC